MSRARSVLPLVAVVVAALVTQAAHAQDRDREAREQVRQTVLDLRIKLAEVGITYDACDKGNDVTCFGSESARGEFGKVVVKAGDLKLVALPAAARELRWYCGGTRERVANDRDFDWVQIERAGNGAITWKFFKQQ
jgi:hypothetical protein